MSMDKRDHLLLIDLTRIIGESLEKILMPEIQKQTKLLEMIMLMAKVTARGNSKVTGDDWVSIFGNRRYHDILNDDNEVRDDN